MQQAAAIKLMRQDLVDILSIVKDQVETTRQDDNINVASTIIGM